MGTNVYLDVDKYAIYVGRNECFEPLGELFQNADLVPADDREDEPAYVMRKSFEQVLQRLRLLGISDESVKREFAYVMRTFGSPTDIDAEPGEEEFLPSFDVFNQLVAAIDTQTDDQELIYTSRQGYEGYLQSDVAPRAGLTLAQGEASNAAEILQHLPAYSLLWLLGKNPDNLQRDIVWNFADHVRNGWSTTEDHPRELRRRHRFLVVTEGTSDARIIRKALDIRRPAVADFIYFHDISAEAFPYTGHGGLRGFCQAMVAINVLNQMIVVFDNDAAATASAIAVEGMALPQNVRVLRLPDLPPGTVFATEGPNGPGNSEINGRAAAIETYLDLRNGPPPVIRWNNFVEVMNTYHGVLERKEAYVAHFDQLVPPYGGYDFSRFDLILDALIATAANISGARVINVTIAHADTSLPIS